LRRQGPDPESALRLLERIPDRGVIGVRKAHIWADIVAELGLRESALRDGGGCRSARPSSRSARETLAGAPRRYSEPPGPDPRRACKERGCESAHSPRSPSRTFSRRRRSMRFAVRSF
jgi:hypothetical protein